MSGDPLADVIDKAMWLDSRPADVAAAVRAHIAAILDAEEAQWIESRPGSADRERTAIGAEAAIRYLRPLLLGDGT